LEWNSNKPTYKVNGGIPVTHINDSKHDH
jgi:hypothetical protein